MVAGVDILWQVCVLFYPYRERQRLAGAGDDGTTREVRQDGQTARSRAPDKVQPVTGQYRGSDPPKEWAPAEVQDAGGVSAPVE
jgi:hypothetical protein